MIHITLVRRQGYRNSFAHHNTGQELVDVRGR